MVTRNFIDGTVPISEVKETDANWETQNTTVIDDFGNEQDLTIFKIKLKSDSQIVQVFHNRKEIINARLPSAQWEDDSVYKVDSDEKILHWFHGYEKEPANDSQKYYTNGEIIDHSFNQTDGDITTEINLRKWYDKAIEKYGSENFSLNDAQIILNTGSFRTFARKITGVETPDESTDDIIKLSYTPISNSAYKTKHHYYYLQGHLEFLNSENECFLDLANHELYISLQDGETPTDNSVKVKLSSKTYQPIEASQTLIENTDFFATTLNITTPNTTVRNCNFIYPSCYSFMIDKLDTESDIIDNILLSDTTTEPIFNNMTKVTADNCTFQNCTFMYTDGSAIEMIGDLNTIDGCLFHHIDKTCANLSSIMTSIRMHGDNNVFSNNTIYKTGASATINCGNAALIEYNDIYDTGYLQSDGAMIQCMVNQQPNTVIRFNWLHDSIKYGARFDGNGEGHSGYIHHNVCWNVEGGIMVKGGIKVKDGIIDDTGETVGGHYVYNNTCFNSNGKNDIIVLNEQSNHQINNGTLVFNNLANIISGHRTNETVDLGEQINPGISDPKNYKSADLSVLLKSVEDKDFRPKPDYEQPLNSNIVGQGLENSVESPILGFTSPSADDNPTNDIGALQHDTPAWVTGSGKQYSIHLNNGWNLVGFEESALLDISSNIESIYYFDNQDKVYKIVDIKQNNLANYVQVSKNLGYWVLVENDSGEKIEIIYFKN